MSPLLAFRGCVTAPQVLGPGPPPHPSSHPCGIPRPRQPLPYADRGRPALPCAGPRVSWGPQPCGGRTLSPLTCLPSLVGTPSPQSMASAWSGWQSVGAWGPLGPGWAAGWQPLPPRLHAIVRGSVSRRVTCSRCPGCVPLPSLAVRSWTPAVGLSLHESRMDAVASALLSSSLLARSSGQDRRLCRLGAARVPPAPQHLVLRPHFSVFMASLLSLEHEKSSLEVPCGRVGTAGPSANPVQGRVTRAPSTTWIETLARASWADRICQRGSRAASGALTPRVKAGPQGMGSLETSQTPRLEGTEASVCPDGGPGYGPPLLSSRTCPVPTETRVLRADGCQCLDRRSQTPLAQRAGTRCAAKNSPSLSGSSRVRVTSAAQTARGLRPPRPLWQQ